LALEPLEVRQFLAVDVFTDKLDYAPGETAQITASGFQVGETVEFQVLHIEAGPDGQFGTADDTLGDNTGAGHDRWQVTDGGPGDLDGLSDGNIQTTWYVEPDDSLGETFELTATGLTSGEEATTIFTDSDLANRLKLHNVWDPIDQKYEGGNPSGYSEGDTASFLIEMETLSSDDFSNGPLEFTFRIELDLDNDPYAFTDIEPYDITVTPTISSTTTVAISDTDPDLGVLQVFTPTDGSINVDITSATYIGVDDTGPIPFQTWEFVFTIDAEANAGEVFFVYGAHLAEEGDALPPGGTPPRPAVVPAPDPNTHGASGISGTFQARVNPLQGGDKTVNFKGADLNPVEPAPSIEIIKSILDTDNDGNDWNDDGDGIAEAGETIDYNFQVTNTGNVTLTNVVVTDPLMTVGPTALSDVANDGVTTLAAGDVENATGQYTLTQADIDAGTFVNTADADGTDPNNTPVNDDDTVTVTLPLAPSIEIIKTGTLDLAPLDDPEPGDVIAYEFLVTNTGNLTLIDVVVTDPLTGLSAIDLSAFDGALSPGESFIATATYNLTQDDIDAGEVTNTATVVGNPSNEDGDELPDVPDVTDSDDEVIPLESADYIIIDDGDPGFDEAGIGHRVSDCGTYSDHRQGIPGSGYAATWTFTNLEPGLYLVSGTWLTHFVNASNAEFTLAGGGSTVVVHVNQRAAPDDFTESGITWENLGVVEVDSSGTLIVTLTSAGADGYVVADAVRIARAAEIGVSDGSVNVVSGGGGVSGSGNVDFGQTELGEQVIKTVTVENTGSADLNLGAISVVGTQFSLASPPAVTVVSPGAPPASMCGFMRVAWAALRERCRSARTTQPWVRLSSL
jgi:uncharacterized repeat protein (TIGR01451 family)